MQEIDIIKAWECCGSLEGDSCFYCPLSDLPLEVCVNTLSAESIKLINRKQANADRLKRERDKYIDVNMFLSKLTDEQQDKLIKYQQIENTVNSFWSGLQQLSILKGKDTPTLEELLEYIEQVKAAAYSELAERLCNDRVSNDPIVIAVKAELKEITGG